MWCPSMGNLYKSNNFSDDRSQITAVRGPVFALPSYAAAGPTLTIADFLIARPAVAKAMARQARAIKRYVIPLARDKKHT